MTLSRAILGKKKKGQTLYDATTHVTNVRVWSSKAPIRFKGKNGLPFILHFRGAYRPILRVAVGGAFVGRNCGGTGLRIRGEARPLLSFLARRLLVNRELLRYLCGIRQPRGICGCGLCGKCAGSGRFGLAVCCRSGRRWCRWLGRLVGRRALSWLDGRLILVI